MERRALLFLAILPTAVFAADLGVVGKPVAICGFSTDVRGVEMEVMRPGRYVYEKFENKWLVDKMLAFFIGTVILLTKQIHAGKSCLADYFAIYGIQVHSFLYDGYIRDCVRVLVHRIDIAPPLRSLEQGKALVPIRPGEFTSLLISYELQPVVIQQGN